MRFPWIGVFLLGACSQVSAPFDQRPPDGARDMGQPDLGGSDAGTPPDASISADAGTEDQGAPEAPLGSFTVEDAVCRLPLPTGTIEGQDARCVDLITRQERLDPSSGEVQVHAIVFDEAQPGLPVYVLQGGPGLLLQAYAPYLDEALRRARFGARPVVLVEQRGVGASTPRLQCGAREAPATCISRLRSEGTEPERFGTTEAADDVAALSRGLGHERFALAGGSYGSRLALEVLRRHPGRVSHAYLESLVPPQAFYLGPFASGTASALARLLELCAESSACEAEKSLADAAFTAAEERPVSTVYGALGPSLLTFAIVEAQYHQDLLPRVPAALDAVVNGDQAEAERFLQAAFSRPPQVERMLNTVILCLDIAPLLDEADLQSRLQSLPGGLRQGLSAIVSGLSPQTCAGLGLAPGPVEARSQVSVSTPILLVAPELDARTPQENVDRVAATLPGALLLKLPGRAHTPALGYQYEGRFTDLCAAEVMRSFLDAPQEAPPGCESPQLWP